MTCSVSSATSTVCSISSGTTFRRARRLAITVVPVNTTDDGWHIDVPLPGIDPQNINLEVAGSAVTIRAEEQGENGERALRYEQSFTIPQFLALEKITASHKHGMLRLTVPLKENVKPRRIQIAGAGDKKQIAA